jgi:hypothetical protein
MLEVGRRGKKIIKELKLHLMLVSMKGDGGMGKQMDRVHLLSLTGQTM